MKDRQRRCKCCKLRAYGHNLCTLCFRALAMIQAAQQDFRPDVFDAAYPIRQARLPELTRRAELLLPLFPNKRGGG